MTWEVPEGSMEPRGGSGEPSGLWIVSEPSGVKGGRTQSVNEVWSPGTMGSVTWVTILVSM